MMAITTAWSTGVATEWFTFDRVKVVILIITTLTGWYQAWIKGNEVTATQQQVTNVAAAYHYHYQECE